VNNINDQLDATIKILLIFESAQHRAIFAHLQERKTVVYGNVVYCPKCCGWLEVRGAAA
jgi:hypothetical protein